MRFPRVGMYLAAFARHSRIHGLTPLQHTKGMIDQIISSGLLPAWAVKTQNDLQGLSAALTQKETPTSLEALWQTQHTPPSES